MAQISLRQGTDQKRRQHERKQYPALNKFSEAISHKLFPAGAVLRRDVPRKTTSFSR
jgi:hypothetical protein